MNMPTQRLLQLFLLLYGIAWVTAVKGGLDMAKHKARLLQDDKKPNKIPALPLFNFDGDDWCRRTKRVIGQKDLALRRLMNVVNTIQTDEKLSDEEKTFQVSRFSAFAHEMNETSQMILRSFDWLDSVLHGDYKNIINMRESTSQRLEALRDAALREEQEYNAIITAEEKMKKINATKVEGIIEEILQDVALAADQLESDLNEHVFDNAMDKMDKNEMGKGNNIETVIKLEGEKSGPKNDSAPQAAAGGLIKLVDSQDNQFVLAKGKDSTIPQEDHHFIQDVIFLLLLAFLLGWLCTLLNMPSMFGYILSGLILGPSGLNILKSLVQVESLGEFGVFFILFAVGLEFSPDIIKKVFRVAVLGTSCMSTLMVIGGLAVGYLFNAALKECAFVAMCVSLSSTPLVVKFLNTGSESEENGNHQEYGAVLLGILVMQDIWLGVLMAVLPIMAASGASADGEDHGSMLYVYIILKLLGAMTFVLLIVWFLAKVVIGRIYKYLLRKKDNEITVLATVFLVFAMLMSTNYLQISMEVGCFLAGVVISAQGHQLAVQVESLLQPVRDVLACIFFASIGLHVFPSFMAYEMTYLTTFTIFTVTAKFIIGVVVLSLVAPHSSYFVKWVVSAGLSQVSEFSFVLGSRARRLGLISREVYLLILSITTLSLLMAPLLWKMALWQLRIKPRNSREHSLPIPDSYQSSGNCSDHSDDDFVVVSPPHSPVMGEPKRRTLSR